MNINITKNTVEKWAQLKRKGNFANDESFLSHLLDHHEICPLVLHSKLAPEPSGVASNVDERFNIEPLTVDAENGCDQVSVAFGPLISANYSDVHCMNIEDLLIQEMNQEDTVPDLENDNGSSKSVRIGEITRSPAKKHSFQPQPDSLVFKCRKFTNPKVVLRPFGSSDVKNQSNSVESCLSARKILSTFGKKTSSRELELNVKRPKKQTSPYKRNMTDNGVLTKWRDEPTLGDKVSIQTDDIPVQNQDRNACRVDMPVVIKTSLVNHVRDQVVNIEHVLIEEMNEELEWRRDSLGLGFTMCDICGAKIPLKNLGIHLKKHSNLGPSKVSCDKCGKLLRDRGSLKKHISSLHRTKDSPVYECSQCPKKFASTGNLSSHVKCVHLKQYNYECDVCQKRFFSPQHLRTHKYIHTGEKPLKCEVCSLNFRNGGNLSKHMIGVHNIRKKYNKMIIKQLDGTGGKNNENLDEISTDESST